eukprot:g11987.t1
MTTTRSVECTLLESIIVSNKNNKQSLNMPASMTLNYFGLPGRAEATRVALAYAGENFEDHKMDFAEYGACKWAGKGLPVLEVHAIIANVEANFLTGIPTTLIKDTAASLVEVQAAVLEDPKVKAYYASKKA